MTKKIPGKVFLFGVDSLFFASGCTGSQVMREGRISDIDHDGRSMGPAFTVVHKDTLKKFPALPRLLEKVGTRVVLDDGRLDGLVSQARSEKPAKVARNYLKEVKLI